MLKRLVCVGAATALLSCGYEDKCSGLDLHCAWLPVLGFAAPHMAVAAGANCRGWFSNRVGVWQSFQFPGCTTGSINAVTYGGGKFVAVGSTNGANCSIWTSGEAYTLSWTQQSCGPATFPLTSVAFGSSPGSSEFVAAGTASGATFQAVSSLDGVTWNDATISEAGAGGTVLSVVFWETGSMFVESTGTPQNTRRRSVGGGTNWVDGDNMGVSNPRLAAGPTVSGNRRILGFGNSPSVVQYSDDAYTTAAINYSPNVFGTALPVVNSMVYGEGKVFVFVRDSCGVTVSASAGGADNSGNYTMTTCTDSNLKSVAYIDPYFIAGSDNGYFYYSTTGTFDSWSRSPATATGTVLSIAGRPGI